MNRPTHNNNNNNNKPAVFSQIYLHLLHTQIVRFFPLGCTVELVFPQAFLERLLSLRDLFQFGVFYAEVLDGVHARDVSTETVFDLLCDEACTVVVGMNVRQKEARLK